MSLKGGGLPRRNSDYGSVEYWDKRYEHEREYEWLAAPPDILPILKPTLHQLPKHPRILQLGCGNSQLSVELHKAGYTNMVNIDISSVCVANMKEEYPELSFLEMDMTRLSFPENSFDLVVEKATLDSLLVDAKSPWNLTSPGHKLVSKALREVKRVLKPSGLFLSITFSQPHHRVPLLAQPGLNWSVIVDKLPGAFDYYILTMKEGGEEGSKEALSRWAIGEGPSLDWSKDSVSEDEETFILSLDCFTSEESEGENDSILL